MLCWGANERGQLGVASPGTTTPLLLGPDTDWNDVIAGRVHTCGLRSGGELSCWGGNNRGQLGVGNRADRSTPTPVTSSWLEVATLWETTCGRGDDRLIQCWGANDNNALGLGLTVTSDRVNPTAVRMSGPGMGLDVGQRHVCQLTDLGDVQCWGDDFYSQLGQSETMRAREPSSSRSRVSPCSPSGHCIPAQRTVPASSIVSGRTIEGSWASGPPVGTIRPPVPSLSHDPVGLPFFPPWTTTLAQRWVNASGNGGHQRQQPDGESSEGWEGTFSDFSRSSSISGILAFAFTLAFFVRFEGVLPPHAFKLAAFAAPYVVIFQYGLLRLFGVPSFAWRYVGLREAKRIALALGIAAADARASARRESARFRLGLRALSRAADRRPSGELRARPSSGSSGVRVVRRSMAERHQSSRLREPGSQRIPTLPHRRRPGRRDGRQGDREPSRPRASKPWGSWTTT